MPKTEYSLEQKYAAAAHYYQYHNLKKCERDLGIPVATLSGWKESVWWDDLTKQVIKDIDAKMRSTGLEIIEKAQAAILDRLDNGDSVITKTGQIVRKPAALRDVLFTFLTTFDKNRIINMQPTSVNGGSAVSAELTKQLREIGEALRKQSEDSGKTAPNKVSNTVQVNLPEAKVS